MARSVAEINTIIVNNLVTQFASAGITINPVTWSTRNLLRLICYTVAIAQATLEQLWDVAIATMTAIQEKAIAGSYAWLQDRIFKFQYSPTVPQLLVMSSGYPVYANIDPTLRIINACAITSTISNQVNVKVATGSPLAALTTAQKNALTAYLGNIGIAGITYNVISKTSDKLYVEATIYYQGSYSAIIQTNVIDGITDYLTNLSKTRFGGDILMSDLEVFVRGIDGVTDVVFERVSCRTNAQSLFAGIDLILGADLINRKYVIDAGYMIPETTVGSTFADKLTFIAE